MNPVSRVANVRTYFIGPSRDGKQLLEVMAEVTPPRDFFIFHVMNARPKIIEKARRLSI